MTAAMEQYRTRDRAVFAIKFDGTNLDQVRAAVEAQLGQEVSTLGNMLAVNSCPTLPDGRQSHYMVMVEGQWTCDYCGVGRNAVAAAS
jgi:hypothetical protein